MRSKGIKTPALVVALGTTATKAARELCEHLLTMEQDDRDAVALVTIDTDTARPEFAKLLEENPGKFHAFNAAIRVPPQVDYAEQLPPRDRRHIFEPNYVPRYTDYGAGGIRNHGHVALAYRLDEVYSAVQDALASIKLLPSGEGHVVTDSVQVYVVAFLGGGTGSGIVADLGVILRNLLGGEMEGQRLLLFGILPLDRIPGSGANEESWRKSNATAAMLEIMAAGLAAGAKSEGFYRKRLLSRSFLIPKAPLFNEMYLVGRTNLNDVDNVARMVGLDMFQRIADASGIGDRERSQSPDFKNLQDLDDEQLPTNISASCPVEVRFPADEVCEAFAQLTAGRLLQLPDFIGEVPAEPTPDLDAQGEWEMKWDNYARPSQGASSTGAAATLARPLLHFDASDFVGSGPNKRRMMWAQAQEAIGRFPSQLDRLRAAIEDIESKRVDDVPPAKETDRLVSYPARRLIHLSLLHQEYAHILRLFDQNPQEPPEAVRDERLEQRLDSILPFGLDRLLPQNPITESMEQGRAHEVADAYNGVIADAWDYQRYVMMTELLRRLVKRVSDLYAAGKRDMEQASSGATGQYFIERALTSQAWQGRLARQHPHMIGLFDIDRFRKTQNASDLPMQPAMVGLYRWATITPRDGDNVLTGCDKPLNIADFDAELRASWMEDCILYLNKARRQDVVEMKGANLSESERRDALAADAARMSERVLEYCRQRYREFFKKKNLFDLLRVGYAAETGYSAGQAWREVPDMLRTHLVQMSRVLRLMLKADPGLWRQGAETVRPTLYLGINYRDDTPEQAWIETLAREVRFRGPLESPKIDYELDPHRMQMNLALHAISIRTIPMFFMRENSLMSEYVRYQRAWQGSWRPDNVTDGNGAFGALTNSGHSGNGGVAKPYGEATPVHTSEEMERLTLDPRALGHGFNLIERILRETPQTSREPNWDLDDDDEDDTDSASIFFAQRRFSGGAPGGQNGRRL